MTIIVTSSPSIDVSIAQFLPQISGLLAGSSVDAGAPCYITSGSKVAMSTGSDAGVGDEFARVVGFAARSASADEPVTLMGIGARFRYAAGTLTPGQPLYLEASASHGRLNSASNAIDPFGIAMAINGYDIVYTRYIVSGCGGG